METFTEKKLLRISHIFMSSLVLILMVACGTVLAQSQKTKECPDKKKSTKRYKSKSKSKPVKSKPVKSKWTNFSNVNNKSNSVTNNFSFSNSVGKKDIAEKSISANSKAYISFCVVRGSVKVNGWNRKEARIFIKGRKSSQVGFKVREKSRKDGKPVWIQVLGHNPKKVRPTSYNTCLSGDIELDVPKNASVKIENTKGQSRTTVDSVRAANVEVLGGEIYLSNITQRINAQTYQGGVTVRNSSGKMFVATNDGNIIAHNTYSSDIGDYFKARTRSGAITLQSVEQKEVKSSSILGSINYVGRIAAYGKYDFNTTKGSINLAIPKDSSCQIVAAYGGAFSSELPMKNIFKERTGSLVFLRGKMGKGEANLNLKSFNGTIRIREKKSSVLASF